MPETNLKKLRKGSKPKPPSAGWKWGPEQEIVFKPWTEKLTTSLILGNADYSLSFEIHTDASTSTCSSTLYQKQDNINRVIAYAIRSLSKSGENYPFHKLELPALKWVVCENLETTFMETN